MISDDDESAEVLIIDDQQFNLFAMKGQLSHLGAACDTAISGEKAMEVLEQRLEALTIDKTFPFYKLILLDYSMPGMSGPETARKMKRLFDEF